MFSSPIEIPTTSLKHYRTLRVIMYVALFIVTIIFALRVLFPTIVQSFDFRSPESGKNAIQNPRSIEGTPRTNGKIEEGGTMKADTTVVGDFSLLAVTAALEKDSVVPESLSFSVRRSYQGFLYPTGEPSVDFPDETVYVHEGVYYALRDGTLYPFVSEQAYLSRFPQERAETTDNSLLTRYPISDEWLGFRVGSLLGNATGVFIVVSETEVRPVGSAEIFLALGYDFADVLSVSEEELGVYKRGRIFLLGATHPDGTLYHDLDTDTYFMVDGKTKRPLDGPYRDFLTKDRHPILVSTKASEMTAGCTLMPSFFGTSLSCETDVTTLPEGYGNDFELTVAETPADIDINALTLSFETAKNKQNMLTLLSKIKQRLLSRFLF